MIFSHSVTQSNDGWGGGLLGNEATLTMSSTALPPVLSSSHIMDVTSVEAAPNLSFCNKYYLVMTD